jgi:hypothetical protein
MRTAPIAAVILMSASGTALVAQQPTVGAGSRIRFATPGQFGGYRVSGTVVAHEDSVWRVAVPIPGARRDSVVNVGETSFTSLEVSSGTRSRVGNGLLLGALLGTGAGALGGLAACNALNCDQDYDWSGMVIGGGAAAGLGVGLLAGGLLGAFARSERWVTVK